MEDVLYKLKMYASTKMETESSKGDIIISRGSLAPVRWALTMLSVAQAMMKVSSETPTPEHGDSNEKAQDHRTHLAGRRDPAFRR